MDAIGFLALLAVMVAGYFLPSLVAAGRNHHNGGAIAVLNVLLGWTFIGWVVALVWACTEPRAMTQYDSRPIRIQPPPMPGRPTPPPVQRQPRVRR